MFSLNVLCVPVYVYNYVDKYCVLPKVVYSLFFTFCVLAHKR